MRKNQQLGCRRRLVRSWIAGVLLLGFSVAAAWRNPAVAQAAKGPQTLHAGYAQTELQVPVGHKMLAFPIRKDGKIIDDRSNQGTHDPIFIRCLVFREKETAVALVSADVAIISDSLIAAVRERIQGKIATPAENILIGATHNHQGPVLDHGMGSTATAEWTGHVIDLFSRAIIEAHRELVPARAGFGHGFVDLNYNRLFIQPDGRAKFVPTNPEARFYGPADKEVVVLRVDRVDGRPLATVFNYALHPVVLRPQNRLISADFPGAAYRTIESGLGAGTGSLFFNGAEGEMNPYPTGAKEFTAADQVGATLGKEVLRVHATIRTSAAPGLAVASRTLVYQDRNNPELQGSARLQVVTLAKASMVTVPGELFAEAGMEYKRRSPYPNNMILGLTGGSIGYIPQREAYRHGGYGVDPVDERTSRMGIRQVPEGFAERIWEAWLDMAGQLWKVENQGVAH